jgi:hypothetical protein
MRTATTTFGECDAAIESFAAELTEASYPVVLRHGVKGSSIDLQLELWHTLADTLKKNQRKVSPAPSR